MKVLIFSSHFVPGYKGGGPIKTIKNLLEQAGDEIDFKVITSDRDLGDKSPYNSVINGAWNKVGNSTVFYAQSGLAGLIQIGRGLVSESYDVVYLNSFFAIRFSLFPLLMAKILGQRIVLGPRGELSEGALTLKRLKKRVFINAFKFFGLHKGVVFQASTDFEANDIRKALGETVDVLTAENIGSQEFAIQLRKRPAGPLRAVFVSRISPKKNLLKALEILRSVRRPIIYHIYGPVEDEEYWTGCRKVIAELPSHIEVELKGALIPDEVVKTLTEYDVFFFPTKGENYGHVIAEALCAGLPIIVADTTPWRNLDKLGIGWDLPLSNPEAFAAALDRVALMSRSEHFEMRKDVLAWAKQRFSQVDAVEANISLFKYAYEKQ